MDFHDFQMWKPLEIITTEARDLLYMTFPYPIVFVTHFWIHGISMRARAHVCTFSHSLNPCAMANLIDNTQNDP